MANVFMNEAKLSLINGNIAAATDTIKYMIVTNVYTPNADDQFIDTGGASDAVDARVAGTTDQTIGSKTLAKDTTSDFAYFDGADVTFTAVAAGATVVGGLAYKDTGTPTTSKIICYHDVTDTPTNGGDITIQFATPAGGGILRLN
jgi:hypothetical protein